jgi:hypothetical protein
MPFALSGTVHPASGRMHPNRAQSPWSARRRRWALPVLGALALITGCSGDPYERYGAVVHADVDAAMVAAFRMTARAQLTVVHNTIPLDSLAVVAAVVRRAAHEVRERATHFAAVAAPSDLALIRAHAQLSAQLVRVAEALEALASTFQQCADSARAGEATEKACEAHLATVNSRFAYVGEDLNGARSRVQRLLLPHGVMLRRMMSTRGRLAPAVVDLTSGRAV